jgi:hypothetical protein
MRVSGERQETTPNLMKATVHLPPLAALAAQAAPDLFRVVFF